MAVDVYLEESEDAISGNTPPTFDFAKYGDEDLLANYINGLQEKLFSIVTCFDAINKSALETLENYSNIFTAIEVPEIIEGEFITKSSAVLTSVPGVITGSTVNLRAGSSTSTDVITTLKEGTELLVTGEAVDGFYPVITSDGQEGFVSAKYLNVKEPVNQNIPETIVVESESLGAAVDAPLGGTATITGPVHLRAGETTDTESQGVYPEGTKVTLTGREVDRMVEVITEDGKVGYMGKKYLNYDPGTVTKEGAPSKIKNNTETPEVTVEQPATETEVPTGETEVSKGETKTATVNVERLRLREGDNTGTDTLDIYKKGTIVTLTGNEHAGMVEVITEDGKTGWMGKKSLNIGQTSGSVSPPHETKAPARTEQPIVVDLPKEATVNVDNLYLREGDNTGTKAIGVYHKGDKVKLTGEYVNGMVKVELPDGSTGWMGYKSLKGVQ